MIFDCFAQTWQVPLLPTRLL